MWPRHRRRLLQLGVGQGRGRLRALATLEILDYKGGGARGGDRRYSLLEKGKEEEQMRLVTLMLAAVAMIVGLFAAVAYVATVEEA